MDMLKNSESFDFTRDFRRHLQSEFARKLEVNPRYSLRAFAKTLGLSHATLSHLISGRRPFSDKMVRRMGLKMGLSPSQINHFIGTNSAGLGATGGAIELSIDTFTAMSEWYHDAILEISKLSVFKTDPKWIAKRLGITVNQVNMAVERLQNLELLEILPNGKWLSHCAKSTTPMASDFTHAALRKYQKKILELSIQALEEVPKIDREHVSNMIAIQVKDLEKVRVKIQEFRKEIAEFLERKEAKPNEVYQLNISFFPITKKN